MISPNGSKGGGSSTSAGSHNIVEDSTLCSEDEGSAST